MLNEVPTLSTIQRRTCLNNAGANIQRLSKMQNPPVGNVKLEELIV
jgi:hypothetical protein